MPIYIESIFVVVDVVHHRIQLAITTKSDRPEFHAMQSKCQTLRFPAIIKSFWPHTQINYECGVATSSTVIECMHACMRHALTSLVKTQRHDMRVHHADVKGRDVQIEIREHYGHRSVDDAVVAVHVPVGLVGVSGVVARQGQ